MRGARGGGGERDVSTGQGFVRWREGGGRALGVAEMGVTPCVGEEYTEKGLAPEAVLELGVLGEGAA